MSESPQTEEMQTEGVVVADNKNEEDVMATFQQKLKELNIGFLTAVQKAVSENPACSLIPLVKDYLHYHRGLLEEHSITDDDSSSPKTFKSLGTFWDDFEMSIGAQIDADSEEPEETRKRKIGDADGVETSSDTMPSSESPDKKFASSPNSSPFANFSFNQSDNDGVKIVEEADALFSTRCKIFEIVKGSFPNLRGVGMLYIKKLEDNRYQLLVRADNVQGKVLLNIPIQISLPIAMKGKDAIATVDVTPCQDGKKVGPIVIKTATWAEADKLFEKLQELQKA